MCHTPKSDVRKGCICLIILTVFIHVLLASPAQAVLDNDGRLSGLFASIFGPSAIYPAEEYILSFSGKSETGSGGPGTATDIQSLYHQITYRVFLSLTQEEIDELTVISGLKIIENLEILVLGEFTNSRSLNFTNYDNHSMPTTNIMDVDVGPLSSWYSNPYSTIYSENRFDFRLYNPQYYALKIRIGDTYIDEDSVEPACSLSNYTADQNIIDATLRHGIDQRWIMINASGQWNREFDPGFDPGSNLGGQFAVRRYGDETPDDPDHFHTFRPIVVLRETNTGCPIPYRTQGEGDELIEYDITHKVVTNQSHGEHIPGSVQVQHTQFHIDHGNFWTGFYYGMIPEGEEDPAAIFDPNNSNFFWTGGKPFVAAKNPFLGYVEGRFFENYIPAFNEEYSNPADGDPLVLAMHVKLPSDPGFPCEDPGPDGCPGAADSELRYWSMSFTDIVGEAAYSFSQDDVPVVDEVTNVASFVFSFLDTLGEPCERPATLASRFNWVHLPSVYQGENPEAPLTVAKLAIRMQLNDEGEPFSCSAHNIPMGIGEHTPDGVIGSYVGGGFMGDYIPQAMIIKLSDLLTFQDLFTFSPDPVGGDCSTTYNPSVHLDEWWKLVSYPAVPPE